MHYILFNPLSKNGKNQKVLNKLQKLLTKKGFESTLVDIIEANQNVQKYVKLIHRTDSVVIVGGDGTLHRFANVLGHIQTNGMEMYLYRGGTGNDFGREFKGKLIRVTDIIKELPRIKYNDQEEVFLNCSGFGFDGSVCDLVNVRGDGKKGLNYAKSVLKLFKTFDRYDLDVEVDGVMHYYKKVWFATCMNGKYFGGGMKLAPDSNRFDEDIELYVVHHVPGWKLLLIFPLIFIGKHMWFKKVGISKLVGRQFKLHASRPLDFQTDGEVRKEISDFACYSR